MGESGQVVTSHHVWVCCALHARQADHSLGCGLLAKPRPDTPSNPFLVITSESLKPRHCPEFHGLGSGGSYVVCSHPRNAASARRGHGRTVDRGPRFSGASGTTEDDPAAGE